MFQVFYFWIPTKSDLSVESYLADRARSLTGAIFTTVLGESKSFAVPAAHDVVKIHINMRYIQFLPCGFPRSTTLLYLYKPL